MPDFSRLPGKFAYTGMNLTAPTDLLPETRCSLLCNLRPNPQTGALETRPAISQLATTGAGNPVHSVARLNDSVPGAVNPYSRFVGAGTNLYSGTGGAITGYGSIDSGYSGNPLSLVPYRPQQSPEPWMYVYDSAKQQRYKADNSTKQNIGIQAPTTEPGITWAKPLYNQILFPFTVGNWSGGGASGGTVSSASIVDRIPTGSILALSVLYDQGTTGMCCIVPSSDTTTNYLWMTAGSVLELDGFEVVVIEQAFPAGYSTTVAAVQYDNGSTGYCTIVPAVSLPGLVRNMVVQVNGAYCRVLSVIAGPDGSYSFRTSTGGTTAAPGQSITAPPSFRCWTSSNHAINATLYSKSLEFTFTPSVSGGSMTDTVATNPNIGSGSTFDLSQAGGRPIQNEDYMHVSLNFNNPQNIVEVHVIAAMDTTSGSGGFANNYYYYVLRAGDFQPSISGGGTVTTEQATLNSQFSALAADIASAGVANGLGENVPQPPYPLPEVPSSSAPAATQLTLSSGSSWNEVIFKISDMTRVGTNPTLTWNNIIKLGIFVSVAGGPVTMDFGGWWVGGGYGPDCNFNTFGNQAPEIQWRYQYYNSLTGAKSTVSPETRNGEILRRQAVVLTAPNSPDSQVDTVLWERRGGTNPDWHYVGRVAQGTAFTDTTTEAAAQVADPLQVDCYQPWPVTDIPRAGTAIVTGTAVVWNSGQQFNTRWLRGTEIIIGGNTYSFYAPPSSATVLTLAQSLPATVTGVVSFSIPEATIEGQPLYAGWLDAQNNRVLAVGDPLNPGLLYFSNVDNPDGASDSGYIEITSPSEVLLNGFYAEGANYVFSASSLYRVESTPGATNPYASYRLSGVEGMAGPWAFDAQRNILFYWGPDGIYAYAFGPKAENLTALDFYSLFPHGGQPGVPISLAGQTVYPPNYNQPGSLRVGYAQSFVYATYLNSNSVWETLVYSLDLKGWQKDTYTPNVTLFYLEKGVTNPLLLCGGADGNLYNVNTTGTTTDPAGAVIAWTVLTPSRDMGDSRANKQFGDLLYDYSTLNNSYNLTVQVLYNDLLVSGVSTTLPAPTTTRRQVIVDLAAPPQDTDDGVVVYRNIANLVTGGGPVILYEWQPSFLMLPPDTLARVTAWMNGGTPHYKFVQGLRIHADTLGNVKSFQIEYDGGIIGPSLSISQTGEQVKAYSFPPFKAHMMRLVPNDDTDWRLWDDIEWIYQPEPDPANYWVSQPTSLGLGGYIHCRELWLAFATATAGAVVSVIVDGVLTVVIPSLPVATSPVKNYYPLPPLKGRYWQVTASGTGLQLYEQDIEFLAKAWGSTGAYARLRPFGDLSGGGGSSGAKL